jgi:hypothetical protein
MMWTSQDGFCSKAYGVGFWLPLVVVGSSILAGYVGCVCKSAVIHVCTLSAPKPDIVNAYFQFVYSHLGVLVVAPALLVRWSYLPFTKLKELQLVSKDVNDWGTLCFYAVMAVARLMLLLLHHHMTSLQSFDISDEIILDSCVVAILQVELVLVLWARRASKDSLWAPFALIWILFALLLHSSFNTARYYHTHHATLWGLIGVPIFSAPAFLWLRHIKGPRDSAPLLEADLVHDAGYVQIC